MFRRLLAFYLFPLLRSRFAPFSDSEILFDDDINMAGDAPNVNDGSRLLIISNRLPLTIKRTEDGQYNFSMSSGGLVTGLSGLSKTMTYEWYGWPGLQVPEGELDLVSDRLKKECDAHPVFIDDDLADKHYNGFSSAPRLPRPCPEPDSS